MAKGYKKTDLQNLPVCAAEFIKLVVKKMRYRKKVRAEVAEQETATAPAAAAPTDDTEDEDDSKICVVCMDEDRTHAYVPCGHFCVCGTCAAEVPDTCPMCRAPSITPPVKMYWS